MPLPDVPDTFRIVLNSKFQADEVVNVFYYRDVALAAPSPTNVASGFWNHIKAAWRAHMYTASYWLTSSVECERLDGAHPFGVYAIPTAEQQGTRGAGSSDWLPLFVAGAITLQVGTRTTRPGSKRIAGLQEADISGFSLIAGEITLLQALADVFDTTFTPTGAASVVYPVIVGYPTPAQPGAPRVQDVIGAVASPLVSHQVSRDQR